MMFFSSAATAQGSLQNLAPATKDRPEQIAAPATLAEQNILQVGRYEVELWGLTPVRNESRLAFESTAALVDLSGGGPLACQIMRWQNEIRAKALCRNRENIDIGLALVKMGYATVNQADLAGSDYENVYLLAHEAARAAGKGIWLNSLQDSSQTNGFAALFGGNARLFYIWAVAVLVLPALAGILAFLTLSVGFGRLERQIRQSILHTQEREEHMRKREKYVLTAMLESELSANRGKLEAFLVIYNDMLKSLRKSDTDHKYKQTGEIVHEAPTLSRSVYDSNVDKLDILGSKLAQKLIDLYIDISANPAYTQIDPSMPVDDVILKLDKIIAAAEKLITPIDSVIGALHTILREEQAH